MAKTLILRPVSCSYNTHSLYPTSMTADACVSEVSNDGNNTYIYNSNKTAILSSKYSYFQMSGAMPSVPFNVTAIRAIVYAENVKGSPTYVVGAGTGPAPTSLSLSNPYLSSSISPSSSYSKNVLDIPTSMLTTTSSGTEFLAYDGDFPQIWLGVDSSTISLTAKDCQVRISQIYIEIDYEEVVTFDIVVNSPSHAIITADPSKGLESGDVCSLSSVCDDGYKIDYYIINGTPLGAGVTTFTVTEASIVSASVSRITPIVTLQSPNLSKISSASGFDKSVCKFTCDLPIVEWEARATTESQTPGRGIGLLVESGTTINKNSESQIIVDDEELTAGDNAYTISVYVKASNGMWSDGTYESN